jgi:arginase family enzyme
VFESETCIATDERIKEIHHNIYNYFKAMPSFRRGANAKYWISFDIDGIDNAEFKSTGTDEGAGLSFDFVYRLLKHFIPRAEGMDLTEINFQLTEGEVREKDEQTIKELFEFIVH